MQRLLAGAFALLLSIALPATFSGTRFLVVVWVGIGLVGVALIVTSDPVLERLPDRLRRADLKLTVERAEWQTFKHEALILRAKVRVHNRTGHDKQIRSVAFESVPGPGHVGLVGVHSEELVREMWSEEGRHRMLPGRVDAHDSVYGWHTWAVARQLDGGAPAYRITVRDEFENEYSVSKKARPARRRDLTTKWAR